MTNMEAHKVQDISRTCELDTFVSNS